MGKNTFRFRYTDRINIVHPIAQAIADENIEVLEQAYAQGWDVNAPIRLNERSGFEVLPVNLAVSENCEVVICWLLERNARVRVNGDQPIVLAGFACSPEVIRLLVSHGADILTRDNVGKSVLDTAISGEQERLLYVLRDLGFPIENDAGILRRAVQTGNERMVRQLLRFGVDPNRCKADMVHPYNPTPVCTAAHLQNWNLVRVLVEQGADVTIADRYGSRPYTYAEMYGSEVMMTYLRALEPLAWHDRDMRTAYFRSLNLPEELIVLMAAGSREDRTLVGDEGCGSLAVTFNSLATARIVCWQGQQFVDLLSQVPDYDAEGFLVWSIEHRQLGCADFEHDEFELFGTWKSPEQVVRMLYERNY